MNNQFYRFVAGVLLFMQLLTVVMTASASLETDGGYMKGRLFLQENGFLDVDMLPPKSFPETVFQYKLSQLTYSREMVKPLIDKYFIKPQAGENWELCTSPAGEGRPSLFYKEDSAAHGSLYPSYQGMAYPLNESDLRLVRASSNVKRFLDDLGVEQYEYPFYVVMYEHQFQISPRSSIRTQEDFLSTYFPKERNRIEADYEKQGTLGNPAIVIVVRFSIDDIPFAMQNTYDLDQDSVKGDGNPVPYAMFTLTNDGSIVAMWVSRPFGIEKKKLMQGTVYGWRDIVNTSSFARIIAAEQKSGGEYTLLQTEPVYAINSRGVTYPAWRFSIEWTKKEPMDERISKDGPDKLIMDLYFDAITGNPV